LTFIPAGHQQAAAFFFLLPLLLENPLAFLELLHEQPSFLDFFQHLLLVETPSLQLCQGGLSFGNFLLQVLLLLG